MTTTLGHWILPQLERLARSHPEKLDDLLESIRDSRPDLFDELHLMAIEHGQLSRAEVAEMLGADSSVVETRLKVYREAMTFATESQVIQKDRHGVARIADKHITVWEVVREYRRTDEVEAMGATFPGLSEGEIRAALIYAGRNPDEIGAQIRAYEELLERNKAAYPFAKG